MFGFTGNNIQNIKTHNLQTILRTFLFRGPVSRVKLAELTGLSTTTITNLVSQLLQQQILVENTNSTQRRNGAGRPRTMLQLSPSACYAVGVHIGIGKVRVGLTNLFGELLHYVEILHDVDESWQHGLSRIGDLIERVIDEAGICCRERLIGIGVGASGMVNSKTGVNVLAPNLGWRNVPIRAELAQRLAKPVIVDNNVRAMALAESMFGAGRTVNSLAFVYARIGVGAGFVTNGQIHHGSRAVAGEIGHMTIIPAGGISCRCGNTGCLETLVSEPVIIKQAQLLAANAIDNSPAKTLATVENPGLNQVFDIARQGDNNIRVMLRERAHYMGIALANLVNIMDPDMIIMGGIFVSGKDLLLPQIEETLRLREFAGLSERVKLQTTTFGSKAGVVGAATLALEEFFYKQGTLPKTTQEAQ